MSGSHRLILLVQKFTPYNFKNFHALKLERILRKTALVRKVADVGEALPSLTDAGGYFKLKMENHF